MPPGGLAGGLAGDGTLPQLADEPTPTPIFLRATTDPEGHLTMDAKINSLAALTLVDSGATGMFMHPDFAAQCNTLIWPRSVPREVRVIDGRMINSGLITHQAEVRMIVGNHSETLVADITNTARYACILGTPWLSCHVPTIRWSQRVVLFDSPYCQKHCKNLKDGGVKRSEE